MLVSAVRSRLGRWYRRAVPLALRVSLREVYVRRSGRGSGVVSVVVPVYNAGTHLAECLDSVLGQTYGALEVVVVDGCSTDDSCAIAKSYARKDSRVRSVGNVGTGRAAARNAGLARVHGRWLCFVDAGDVLPADAVANMVRSLRASGSDFVVGAPLRIESGGTRAPEWLPQVHAHRRAHSTLDDFPEVVRHVSVGGKLFETGFFRRAVGGFAEPSPYEEQVPTAKAFVAGRFDVLPDPVCHRRADDESAVVQWNADPTDLRDQLQVAERVAAIIDGGTCAATYRVWLAKTLGFDLRRCVEQVPLTGVEYFEQLRRGVQALLERASPAVWPMVPIVDRLPMLAVSAGFRADVTVAVCRRQEYGWFVPTTVRDGTPVLERSYLQDMQLRPPEEQRQPAAVDFGIVAVASSLWWQGTTLRLTGHAYLTNLPYDPALAGTRVELVSSDGQRVAVPVDRRRVARIDIETKDAWNPHSDSGFAVEVDPGQLPAEAACPWRVEVTVSVAGVERTTALSECDRRGIGGTQPVAPARDGIRWLAGFEKDGSLQLRRTAIGGVAVAELRCHGREVSVIVDDPAAQLLVLDCGSRDRKLKVSGRAEHRSGRVAFEFVLPELEADQVARTHFWSMQIHGGSESPRKLTYPGSEDELSRDCPQHHRVRGVMNRVGTLTLAQHHWRVVADAVGTDGDTLTVTGRLSAVGATEISGRMVGEHQVIEAEQAGIDPAAGTFSLRFRLLTGAPVSTDWHGFTVRLSLQLDGRWHERWLRTSYQLQHQLPWDGDTTNYGLTLTRTRQLAALRVRVRQPYLPDERGRLAQRRLHEHFHTPQAQGGGLSPGLRDAVLFECFRGRQIGDSVLALYQELRAREPDLDLYWSVFDYTMPVPAGATPLLVGSRAWMDLLHHARYLVNNSRFPSYFRKRAGQTYIQTWHGTPLKRVGNDAPAARLSADQLKQRETRYWDVLLVQNDFSAELLPKAFAYQGHVLNLGYPRNDALVDAHAPLRRQRIRTELGITDEQRVVLYAPTWRDNATTANGYALVSYLDFPAAAAATGEDTVFLLRGHYYTVQQEGHQSAGVLDVTHYQDVNDLLLASDLLITDYSSLMFDYATTGKPMLFLAPDLDQYRDETRGLYLDFETIAPGPVYRSNEELINTLANANWGELAATERYRAFAERFAPRDDGHASRRVLEALCKTRQSESG